MTPDAFSSSAAILQISCRTYLKSSEKDNETGELDEAEKVVGVIFPADEDGHYTVSGEEALDQPTSHVTLCRRRSCVGGLLRLERCSAIISSESTAPLRAHDGSELACAQHVHREYAPPENASESVPTVNP